MGRPPLVSREAVIAAARNVFIKEGLSASIRDVAAVAGISEAAIFKRFATKTALIVAALAPPAPDVAKLLAPLESADLRLSLAITMTNIVEHFRRVLPMILPIIAQPDVGMEAFLDEFADNPATVINAALAARLAALANDGRLAAIQPFAVSGLIVATAHSLALFEIMGLHAGRSPPAVVEAMIDSLWRGISPA
jgi:AcrR family transcriptional regulator